MWSGNLEGPTLIFCVDACEPDTLELDGVLTAATLEALSREKLRFSSANRPVADPSTEAYTFVVTFADGTDVSINTPIL